MLLRLLLIGAALFLLWRLARGRKQARPAHDPRSVAPAPRSAHEVLGVAPDAPREAIRSAYQTKISQYHPDKVADMGPELQALAEEHTKVINAAYEQLRKR